MFEDPVHDDIIRHAEIVVKETFKVFSVYFPPKMFGFLKWKFIIIFFDHLLCAHPGGLVQLHQPPDLSLREVGLLHHQLCECLELAGHFLKKEGIAVLSDY